METLHLQEKKYNLVKIYLSQHHTQQNNIFNKNLNQKTFNKYLEKLVFNQQTITKKIIYNYNNKYYNITDNKVYKLTENKIVRDNNKLIQLCKMENIDKIEFESKKNYSKTSNDFIIVKLNENIDIYFNDTLKQITIYIQFNAYIKESIESVKQFIDSIDN